jgi:hypothetical protein
VVRLLDAGPRFEPTNPQALNVRLSSRRAQVFADDLEGNRSVAVESRASSVNGPLRVLPSCSQPTGYEQRRGPLPHGIVVTARASKARAS